MKIGELSHEAQCTVETVRYYEKVGLLPAPARTASNYRHYGSVHVDQLRFIRNCRALDMTLEEIRALQSFVTQPAGDCSAVNQLLDEHIDHVGLRIAELSQLKEKLSELSRRCQNKQSIITCGILQGLTSMESEPQHDRHTHL